MDNLADMDIVDRFFTLYNNQSLSEYSKKGYRDVLRWLSEYCGKRLEDITEEECKLYLSTITNAYTWNTRHAVIKMFYTWLGRGENFLKMKKRKKSAQQQSEHEEQILAITPEHVGWLINAAQTLRDKALIAVLFECGFRRGEIVSIRLSMVKENRAGYTIRCAGKTGTREVQCVTSAALLGQWLDSHPRKNDPQAPLFCSLEHRDPEHPVRIRKRKSDKKIQPIHIGDALKPGSVRSLLDKVVRWATLSHPTLPHIYPHLGRHFAATSAAKSSKMNTQALKMRFGWKTNTMPDVYCHLTGADEHRAYIESLGMVPEEETIIPVPECPRCKAKNPPGVSWCPRCGAPMTLDVAQKLEEKKVGFDEMKQDPEVLAELTKRVKADVLKQIASDPEILKALLAATKTP